MKKRPRPKKKQAEKPKPWRERRLYVFACVKCGRPKARSHKRSRARLALCRQCRKGVDENPNQVTIFDTAETVEAKAKQAKAIGDRLSEISSST